MQHKKGLLKIRLTLSSFLVVFLVSLGSTIIPVHADPIVDGTVTGINLIKRGTTAITPDGLSSNLSLEGDVKSYPEISCQAAFSQQVLSSDLLRAQLGNKGISKELLQTLINTEDEHKNNPIHTYIGSYPQDLSKTNLQYFVDNYGKTVPVMTFSPAKTQPVNGDFAHDNSACSNFIMIPVSGTEWRGYQIKNLEPDYMVFKTDSGFAKRPGNVTAGTLAYYDRATLGNNRYNAQRQETIINVGGSSNPAAGGNVSVGELDVVFRDAGELEVSIGPHAGEIYKKLSWDKHSYYFLYATTGSTPSNLRAGRESLKLANAPKHCDDPLHSASCDATANCVPFIAIGDGSYDFSFKDDYKTDGTGKLQSKIDQLGSQKAMFYDYGSDCSQLNPTGAKVTLLTNGFNNWFYYNSKTNQFISAFSDGGSNESNYVPGPYDKKIDGLYVGGNNSCSGQILASADDIKLEAFKVTWKLWDPGCNASYGDGITVYAIADEARFVAAQGVVDAATTHVDDQALSPKLKCSSSILNPLTWFICPLVAGAQAVVGQLDDAINSMLTVNVNATFDTHTKSGAAYFAAWNSFRIFGLALIVIAALVMLISNAIGVELLDAYTIRKVLPRLLIAVIGLSLSWYVMRFLVQFSNDAGNGIRSLIYAPFKDIGAAHLGNGSLFALGLVGGAGAIALGLVGLLSLAVTGLLAVLIGFAVLVIRQLLIVMLIMIAPLAIACAILPNTKKAWDLWNDTFIKALLMFPIIAAFIATGRVFAVISTNSERVTTLNSLTAFAAYFAPYFLITFAFKLAGGVLGTIGGIANDRSRGAFDRLRKFRAGKTAENFNKMRTGDRFQGNNVAARAFNRTTAGVGLGVRGRFGLGARGAGAADIQRRAAARAAIQNNPAMQQLAFDDNAVAVMALSGRSAAGARRAGRALQREHGWTEDQFNRAVGTAQAVGFTDSNVVGAMDLMAQNKSRLLTGNLAGQAGMDLVRASARSVSNGNEQLTDNLMGSFAFNSRNAGRLDLGGERAGVSMRDGWGRATTGQHAQSFGASMQAYANEFVPLLQSGNADERTAAAIALMEMQNMLPGATAENQTIINNALAQAYVDHNAVDPTTGAPVSVEQQLSNLAGTISANDIRGRARVYDSQVPLGGRDPATGMPVPPNPSTGGTPKT